MPRPDLSRVPEFFHGYISKVKEDDLMSALANSTSELFILLKSIPVEKHDYRYADRKWTVKEVVQHMIDGERVFTYRALRFARKDDTPLPGFDENLFAQTAKADKRNWNDLIDEFRALRKASEAMFASFDNEQLEAAGVASESPIYVLGIGFVVAGHVNHHCQIIKERYL
ncbi:MAG TPA: DinB family protein [Chitinophagaceae bacterium]|nr:DinB family protein [Chitinophagaceae bacterium]